MVSQQDIQSWSLDSLSQSDGRAVLLEGFPGLGKTRIGRIVEKAWAGHKCWVALPPRATLDELLIDVATQLEADGIHDVADAPNGDFRLAVLKLMRARNVLLVLDDFQNALVTEAGAIDVQIADFVE
ncbi:ATP-binding protein [Curtobacterium flaccumfaciens pv. flaccumfaciens]|uniref:ATP-binding protein n=1 Tax=Curtobacterium flaccumfaciens pv. flaccumfaciens TaxID=138532 RepID=A0A9Q2ZQS1_9MICO|nr:ATP-binding protein [Curtobacterium flaccumfaciens]MBT1541434.1 ATP-binding protein [Curtobacterium flaccumfaciens pv. flaccumfaciens]